MSNALMQQFVAGLKSRNAEIRAKAARDLYHYVSKKLILCLLLAGLVKHSSKLVWFALGQDRASGGLGGRGHLVYG
jgi:hypothetical protein